MEKIGLEEVQKSKGTGLTLNTATDILLDINNDGHSGTMELTDEEYRDFVAHAEDIESALGFGEISKKVINALPVWARMNVLERFIGNTATDESDINWDHVNNTLADNSLFGYNMLPRINNKEDFEKCRLEASAAATDGFNIPFHKWECIDCHTTQYMDIGEVEFFIGKKFSHPARCKKCKALKNATKNKL